MEEFTQSWLKHRTVLNQLLTLIDNEHMYFKPWEGAYTLSDLALHIASSMDMFVQAIKNGSFSMSGLPPYETMDDVRKIVLEFTEKTKQDLELLNELHLEKEIAFNHFYASGKTWLENARDHEIHHKGQLFTYARMIGVEKLPFFIIQPDRR
ncbi:DinB family protein [Bacillus sp. FJAT-49736]|uniref:DinB family protein n=1 Tax=Bacillus sp. FJAT-49736 TaxID=2833582 RepID=UPI0020165B06|nr:DinB family protein [Bacillus sp. FJAT-49736]